MNKKVVVIYSGGMDSFTVLNQAIQQGYQVFALTFNYGQRHVKEVEVAKAFCQRQNINHKVIDISAINEIIAGSSLTSDIDVPTGDYDNDNMASTVVPNRNMILLSLAIGYAVSIKAEKVFYGAHSGDHLIYPDCRPEFVEQMNQVAAIANFEKVTIETPFLHSSKIEILQAGIEMKLNYGDTWTCYNGREQACGQCGSCIERLAAFAHFGETDPLSYE
ncbi:7-cyano-7-deazaguanine synthase QueC [Motilimonas pumila]|uniref:7-cyano-7-deazaguanine synthase n=1 Tax=Motilimonas pumila TaxID=2303987 RepID=A0A418YG87_9GAMM|nr:7-cyano-7-deazaguanine synthase QueC [Motilimonas pumila]RJG48665.1 7-cyano-7-deazaguanine synthase QueC [Motilimonas pumila]